MKTSTKGLELIKAFETCRLKAYPDPKTGGDPWTVGWGATGPGIAQGTIWTQQQADFQLGERLAKLEALVGQVVKVALTQGQFDALVSIIDNVGPGSASRDGIVHLKSGQPSTLLRKLNAGDYAGAADQFLLWVSPGSNVENGLRRRRTAERLLFLGKDAT